MATNGGIIGKSNNASFGKCTVTSKTSTGNLILQSGTRAITATIVGGGASGGVNGNSGGGGGAGGGTQGTPTGGVGGSGGPGIVIIRYKFQ